MRKLLVGALASLALASLIWATAGTTTNGSMTVKGDLTVTGTCTGCGGGVAPSITDTLANIKSTTCNGSNEGQIGLPNNSVYQGMCHSSAWTWWFPSLGPVTLPGVCSDYGTAYNTGANWTCTDTNGVISVTQATNATLQFRGIYKATPSTPFTKTMCGRVTYSTPGSNSAGFGMFLTDGTKVAQLTVEQATASSSTFTISEEKWTNSTTNSATTTLAGVGSNVAGYNCFQVVDNGSTIVTSWSQDGVTFQQILSENVGTFITPSGYGFGGYSKSLTGNVYASIVGFN